MFLPSESRGPLQSADIFLKGDERVCGFLVWERVCGFLALSYSLCKGSSGCSSSLPCCLVSAHPSFLVCPFSGSPAFFPCSNHVESFSFWAYLSLLLDFPSTPCNSISVSGFKVIIFQEMEEQRKSACAYKQSELYNVFKEIWLYFDNTVLSREETELYQLVILNKRKRKI